MATHLSLTQTTLLLDLITQQLNIAEPLSNYKKYESLYKGLVDEKERFLKECKEYPQAKLEAKEKKAPSEDEAKKKEAVMIAQNENDHKICAALQKLYKETILNIHGVQTEADLKDGEWWYKEGFVLNNVDVHSRGVSISLETKSYKLSDQFLHQFELLAKQGLLQIEHRPDYSGRSKELRLIFAPSFHEQFKSIFEQFQKICDAYTRNFLTMREQSRKIAVAVNESKQANVQEYSYAKDFHVQISIESIGYHHHYYYSINEKSWQSQLAKVLKGPCIRASATGAIITFPHPIQPHECKLLVDFIKAHVLPQLSYGDTYDAIRARDELLKNILSSIKEHKWNVDTLFGHGGRPLPDCKDIFVPTHILKVYNLISAFLQKMEKIYYNSSVDINPLEMSAAYDEALKEVDSVLRPGLLSSQDTKDFDENFSQEIKKTQQQIEKFLHRVVLV